MIDKSTWVEQYTNGSSSNTIAKNSNVTSMTVLKHLKQCGVQIRTFSATTTFNVPINDILNKFDDGMSVSKLAIEYGYSITGMSNLLKRNSRIVLKPEDISTNDWSFIESNRQLFLYWLGWMLSDGCIHHRKRDGRSRGITAYLTTIESDKFILEFFRDIINKNQKLKTQHNVSRLDLSMPRKIAIDLEDYGLIPAKSLILKPTEKLNDLSRSEFMQLLVGYIEGDGSVGIKRLKSRKNVYNTLSIGIACGSRDWLDWINTRLIEFGYKSRAISHKVTINKRDSSHNGCYDYRVVGSEAVMLGNELMKCKHHMLDRKWSRIELYKTMVN